MHFDPPVTHGAPMDIDDTDSFFNVSDEDNDSFGSEYDDMAEEVEENQVEENLIQIDSASEPSNTTGANSPHFPSVPSAPVIPPTQARGLTGTAIQHPLEPHSSSTTIPPTQARGSTSTIIRHSLVPPSSTTTIPPTHTRSSAGSNFPHTLAPNPISPMPSPQTRSSTGTDTSRPLGSPTYANITAPPQAKGSISSSSRIWQMSLQPSEPRGPPPVYTPSAQPLCVVRNSDRITCPFISQICL